MDELNVSMFSLGRGNCEICPYRVKCKEYSEYMRFAVGKRKEKIENERAKQRNKDNRR